MSSRPCSRRNSEATAQYSRRGIFRRAWIKACVKCGLGEKTGKAWYQYKGLVPHDFRRSAVRNLVNAGVDTATAMKITGQRTLHIFMRYNIISTGQLHEAMEDRKSTRLNSSHGYISYAVFCLIKKQK